MLAGLSAMQITSRSSIEQFVDTYYLPVFRFAARLCDDPERALMLTDRTLRDAVERMRSLPVPVNVRAWLFSILFHKFLQVRPCGCCA
jgi:DNA-directed RNA polymerase specialized sigma24 family protein